MFNKRFKCKKCGRKISNKSNFCSDCGFKIGENLEKNYGMLGADDFEKELDQFSGGLFGGIGGNMLGKMLNSTMKMLEKELQKEMQNSNNQPMTNMELYINGKRVDPSKIKITQKPIRKNQQQSKEQTEETLVQEFTKEKQKEFSELKKTEPATNVRRLADTVIYELTVPGVKTINDVSVVPVGESIEVKAIAKTKAYFKSIPVHMPVKDFYLSNGKLTLELKG